MKPQHLTWIPAISSMVVLATYVTLALHVRLAVGHWPKPMHESYQTGLYSAHAWLFAGFFLFAIVAAAPLWLLSLKFPRFQAPKRMRYIQLAVFGAGWLLFYLYVKIDPGSFTAWFLD